jgi:hypothetical protein
VEGVKLAIVGAQRNFRIIAGTTTAAGWTLASGR